MLSAGCLSVHKKRNELPLPPEIPINPAQMYTLACPDVIEIVFLDAPELSQSVKLRSDGCVTLGNLAPIPIEGLTVPEAARAIAEQVQISPRRLRVHVAEYNSRQVLLYGQVHGEPRVIDYRGPETVVELLTRAGGLSGDAAPGEVHVVRAHLGEGIPAEVLHVNLAAIREKNDERANIRIQPLDEVYVGEAARSRIGKAVPDLLKPLYDGIVGLIPARSDAAVQPASYRQIP